MLRRPPRSTRTDTLFPYTTLFRSVLLRARFSIRFAKLEIKSGAVATDTEIEAHVDTRFESEAVADTESRQQMCAQVRRPRDQSTGTGAQRDAVAPIDRNVGV